MVRMFSKQIIVAVTLSHVTYIMMERGASLF